MIGHRLVPLLVVCALALESGCALTSKADALAPRFFSPELPPPAAFVAAPEGEPLELRLGSVGAASYLDERISYRLHASELGYYEDRRWTEHPEEFLRRALEEELFGRRHVRRVVSGVGSTLDVELTAFEELRGPNGRVRLALRFTLHDDRRSLLEKSLVVERPLLPDGDTDHAQRVATALGTALTIAVAEMSDDLTHALRARRPAPAPAGSALLSPAR